MPTLTAEQLDHFETFGFLAVDEVFDPAEVINPVMDEYADVLDVL
ncbi:MAG: phytanoyl-CoA dioxygenase, partial [Chloroflexi bacterium]|nr:phytanoyl-CoA dioxygenase [Chloroflexota bacterium]